MFQFIFIYNVIWTQHFADRFNVIVKICLFYQFNQIKDLCFSLPTNKTHYSKYCKYAINVKIHSLYLCLRRISNDNYLCNRSVWVCFYVNLFYRASVVKLISFWNLWLLPKRIICKTRRSKDSIPAPYDTLLYCYTFQMCDYHIREEICQLFTFA